MENQNKPLLIRPSRTPKRIPKMNYFSKSFPTIGASTWFFMTVFKKIAKITQNLLETTLREHSIFSEC